MNDWDREVAKIRERCNEGALQKTLDATAAAVAQWNFTEEQIQTMIDHGYEPRAAPNGVSGRPDVWYSGEFAGGHILRYRICKLAGVRIDRHEGSEWDPGGACIHCGYEGTEEWGW